MTASQPTGKSDPVPSAGGSEPGSPANSRHPRLRRWWRVVAGLFIGYVILKCGLSYHWSREPGTFDVEAVARNHARLQGHLAEGQDLAPGYVSVYALIHIMDTLLSKPGGFLSNDRMPPGAWLDNIPNWEYGALTQARDFATILRQDFSRKRAQSEERAELSEAEARLNYEHNAWVLPSAESEYAAGIQYLEQYLSALAYTDASRATYTVRADVLAEWLRRVERRLGGLAIRLRTNNKGYRYDPNVLTSAAVDTNPVVGGEALPSRVEVDDTFFEARGAAWALYHLLKASRIDFQEVIDGQRSMGSMNRALSELHAAIQPLKSPVVMNGNDFGMAPNHSITLAAYLAKAHLAIADLRALLGGGPAGPSP